MAFYTSTRNVHGDDVLLAASPNPEARTSAEDFDVQVLDFVSDRQGSLIGFCDLAVRLIGEQQLVIKHCSVHRCGSLWVTFPDEKTGPGMNDYRTIIKFPDPGDYMQFRAAVTLALAPFVEKAEAH